MHRDSNSNIPPSSWCEHKHAMIEMSRSWNSPNQIILSMKKGDLGESWEYANTSCMLTLYSEPWRGSLKQMLHKIYSCTRIKEHTDGDLNVKQVNKERKTALMMMPLTRLRCLIPWTGLSESILLCNYFWSLFAPPMCRSTSDQVLSLSWSLWGRCKLLECTSWTITEVEIMQHWRIFKVPVFTGLCIVYWFHHLISTNNTQSS